MYLLTFPLAFLQYKGKKSSTAQSLDAQLLACQYNEMENISLFYKHINNQKDIQLQKLIIDDHTTDGSLERIKSLTNKSPDWQVESSPHQKGKKNALKFAIERSQKDQLLLTDIDCCPASESWANRMIAALSDKDAVIGYAPFFKKRTWLNSVQRYDNCWAAIQYLGAASSGKAYMGVGRNMAVRKEAYLESKHNIKGDHLLSGDDDLLIQSLNKNKIGIEIDPDAFVYSEAEDSYSKWLRQKSRQITTSWHYQWIDQFVMMFSAIHSVFLLPLILVVLLFIHPWIGLILLGTHVLLMFGLKGRAFRKLGEGDLIFCLPVVELLFGLHLLILAVVSFFYKKNKWK